MIEDLAPVPDDVTQPWWDATRAGDLLLQRCVDCSHIQHYPREVCTACGSSRSQWVQSAGLGAIDSFTVVHRAPHPDLEVPYVIARVRLDEGPVLLTRIVDAEEAQLRCDAPVQLDWVDIPDGYRMPVFRIRK